MRNCCHDKRDNTITLVVMDRCFILVQFTFPIYMGMHCVQNRAQSFGSGLPYTSQKLAVARALLTYEIITNTKNY